MMILLLILHLEILIICYYMLMILFIFRHDFVLFFNQILKNKQKTDFYNKKIYINFKHFMLYILNQYI